MSLRVPINDDLVYLFGQEFQFNSSASSDVSDLSFSECAGSPHHGATNPTVPTVEGHPRHSQYYLDDGNVTFLVQGTLFKIHRYFLERDSEILQHVFDAAEPAAIGRSDTTAFMLPDVAEDEFVTLLDFYYNGMFTDTLPSTLSKWITLLSISTRFFFSRLRERAIFELNTNYTIDPVQKIVLAQDFCVSEWKKQAFIDLVQREELIQYEEAMRLGSKTSHELYMAREETRKNPASAVCCRCQGGMTGDSTLQNNPSPSGATSIPSSDNCNTPHVSDAVDRISFREEFKTMAEKRTAEKKSTRKKAADMAMLATKKRLAKEREREAELTVEQNIISQEAVDGELRRIGWKAENDLTAEDNDNYGPRFGYGNKTQRTNDVSLPSSWDPGWTTLGGTTLDALDADRDDSVSEDEWDDYDGEEVQVEASWNKIFIDDNDIVGFSE